MTETKLHLMVKPGVILTSTTEPVIVAMDRYFFEAGLYAWVTSCLREPRDQLRIIRNYANRKGIDLVHREIVSCDLDDEFIFNGQRVYAWQPAWSALLNIGVIINPPKPAKVLFDYFKNGVNKKGKVIPGSAHFRGTAFDIGGGEDGIEGEVVNELKVVERAFSEHLPGLKGFLAEHNNNAVHCDCESVKFQSPPSVA